MTNGFLQFWQVRVSEFTSLVYPFAKVLDNDIDSLIHK